MALETENGGSPFTMPVQPFYGGGYGNNNGGFGFGGDGAWLLLFLILCGGWGGFGGGFGGGMMWPMMMGAGMGGFGMDYLYPWLNNSQNINGGFRDQMLNTQISSIGDKITSGFGDVQLGIAGINQGVSTAAAGIQNTLCQGFAGVNQGMASGFAGTSAAINGAQNAIAQQLYNNEIANLNRSFAEQTANAQGFNGVQAGLADAKYVEATEACNTRNQASQNTRDIIDAQTRGTQAILDKLCALELDGVKAQLAQAQRENVGLQNAVNMATMQASQVQQTADIINGTYTRLSQCPVNSTPVYGNVPIFQCQPQNASCGCNGNNFIG